jgi:hypothetical protein
VRIVLTNRGDRAAAPLDVTGELLGERREKHLEEGIAPGGSSVVSLDFTASGVRPGLHALTLLLEHPVEGTPDAAGNPKVASHRAWLLLALGANPPPPVRLSAEALTIDVRGALLVRTESADGAVHRVRLRALTARGLRPEDDGTELAVPAFGSVAAALPIVRAGAPRGSRHAVLLVAESLDEPLVRTAVATAEVDVAPDPSWLPRLRTPLLGLGLLLLAVALGAEVLWARARGRPPPLGPTSA